MQPNLKPFPTLSQSWGIVGIFIVFSIVLSPVAMPFALSSSSFVKELGLLLVTLLTYIGAIAYALWEKKKRAQMPYLYYKNPISAWTYLLLIPLTLSVGIVIEPLTNLLNNIPFPEPFDQIFNSFKKLIESSLNDLLKGTIIPFLMVAIIAPIMEEILCRGIVLEGLLRNYKPAKAIIWSAVLFAVLHLNPWQGIPAFIIGLILGWVYWKTRSVLPCIFIHFVNNCTSFIVSKHVDNPNASMQELLGDTAYWYVYAGATVVFVIFAWVLYALYRKHPKEKPIETV